MQDIYLPLFLRKNNYHQFIFQSNKLINYILVFNYFSKVYQIKQQANIQTRQNKLKFQAQQKTKKQPLNLKNNSQGIEQYKISNQQNEREILKSQINQQISKYNKKSNNNQNKITFMRLSLAIQELQRIEMIKSKNNKQRNTQNIILIHQKKQKTNYKLMQNQVLHKLFELQHILLSQSHIYTQIDREIFQKLIKHLNEYKHIKFYLLFSFYQTLNMKQQLKNLIYFSNYSLDLKYYFEF
ncbi:hypothetical protein TTHERM_000703639 (macronuclear) [Tetrahymena thermophila SB210]|uniref:Uncharacterized protein n=1 Tax=Tetrahymena thermophila (strain SB210) TaxID=312017 RepID=W7X3D0_TETTS|nr:hypothetical protein TTHERM_000703639 [Tetrahymena thermophila SB210]EWS71952.1 hypothetical protein TTHERM_000703639 [Tetrahymena thermophila SB210]|eukprot:XP_012655512.1 hypothetical protein TTHERM_000703639 [Tetrahymena thermophila SB210]